MMTNVTFIQPDGTQHEVDAEDADLALRVAVREPAAEDRKSVV